MGGSGRTTCKLLHVEGSEQYPYYPYPKKEKLSNLEDFQPISLCNTIYKVISKVLANRLKKILKFIIFEEHSGFVPYRSIFEGIIIAHESIHSMRKAKTARMLIKIDIKKAYDQVNRSFLLKFLAKFDFIHAWIEWVKSCIKTS